MFYRSPAGIIFYVRSDAHDFAREHRRRMAHHHKVYVVLLSPDVLREGKFRRCNPGYVAGKPCVYVGMTGLDPDDRFDKHKAGIKSNRFVRRYGVRLMPELYARYNPMPD